MKKKLKKLEKRVDAIAMEVVTLKNKVNDPLVNINFNELSFEEAHKQAYESICKHYGITDTEVKGVTFNQEPKICEENIIKGIVVDSKVCRDCELRYTKGWYRSTKEGNLALLYFDGKDFLYGFNYKGEWEDESHVCQDRKYEAIEEGTVILERESVIEQRLVEEAKRRGFLTKGTKFKSITSGEEGVERIVSNYVRSNNTKEQITLSFDENYDNILRYNNGLLTHDGSKRLGCSNPYIYKDGKWAEVIKKTPTFKPVFMKCTQDQFDRMRPKLESVGCDFTDSLIAKPSYVLTNDNQDRLISFVSESSGFNKQRTEVHTEAEFLEACGYVEETIEYTLENIQVDCRGLREEQIKEMSVVFENAGYKHFHNEEKVNLEVKFQYLFLKLHNNEFTVGLKNEDKTTITYEKFMELFSEKPIEELHAEHKEAKREPKVGDVVKAWDNTGNFIYGVYEEHKKDESAYVVSNIWFDNIELVTEININDFKREQN